MPNAVAVQPSASLQRAGAWLNQPLAIHEDGFRAVIEALQVRDGTPLQNTKRTTVRGSVAIIHIDGPLSKDASWFSSYFGASDYATLAKDLRQALDSPEITAVLFDVDSPGGEAFGCGEFAKMIFAARGDKPIVAYVSGMGCSAAYWLASACDEIVCDASAMVGGIGVRSSLWDFSKMYEAIGIKPYEIVSEQSPFKVVDAANEADRLRVTATMTDMATGFIADVARGRGVTTAKVQADFGKGDVLIGRSALKAGLVDRLGTFESTLAALAGELAPTTRSTGARMSIKNKPASSVSAAKCDGCDRDMDDDDETFCRACHADAADAKVSRELMAATGKASTAEALAVLSGWKQAASEVTELRARVEKQEAAAADGAFLATLKEFETLNVIPPGADHKRRKFAMGLRGKSDAAAQLRAYAETLDPLLPVVEATEPKPEKPVQPTGNAPVLTLAGIGEDERKIAAQLGRPVEELVQAAADDAAGKKWNPNAPKQDASKQAGGAK